MFRSVLKTALAAIALVGLASAANADVASLKLSETGFADVIVNGTTQSDGTESAGFAGSFGTFIGNQAGTSGLRGVSVGVGTFPVTLPARLVSGGALISASTSAAGTLNIFATVQGLTDFLGTPLLLQSMLQGFFVNQITMVSITEETFIDPANGQFTTPIALGSLTFPGSASPLTRLGPLSAPYSLTEEFTITAPAAVVEGQIGWELSAEIDAVYPRAFHLGDDADRVCWIGLRVPPVAAQDA